MMLTIPCETVDLAAYPDLVVIYMGMRVNASTELKTLVGFGLKSRRPDGLPKVSWHFRAVVIRG